MSGGRNGKTMREGSVVGKVKVPVAVTADFSLSQGKQKFPPPWLVAMQRYGPPPSYPNLKIPGLNAPIPEVSYHMTIT